jgi:mRNA interferase MazF
MKRGEVWWVGLGEPSGSEPGYRRPAVVVSANEFNASAIKTVIVAFLTTNKARALDPGNVRIPARKSGLSYESTLNVTQIANVDRRALTERAGRVPEKQMAQVDAGLRLVLAL